MSDEIQCPDIARWQEWILGEGSVLVSDDPWIDHLNHCTECQKTVAELSAADPFFQQSQDALRSSGLTSHDWRVGEGAIAESSDQEANPAIVSLVESLLGPSEDERSMGRLGRFEILGVVGSGGMGIVLKGRSVDMDRIVAIKIPQPQYWQSPETLLILEREARSAAAVVHPNVISIYHVDRYRDVPYLVMPYLPGQSLEQRIRDAGPMTIEETLRIARQVASALAAAHACGVVHRDVKPANILLGSGTERVVLSDFGLAKVQSDATCTATGTFAGTPIYLSPEQAQGCGAGPSGDLFSLGSVIWTMLVGHPPMMGMHTHAIVRQVAEGALPKLPDTRSDVPLWMNKLVGKLHDSVPAHRPTAEQLSRWIETCQRYLVDAHSVDLPKELSSKRTGGRRRLWGTAATITLCLIGVIAWQTEFGSEADIGIAEVDAIAEAPATTGPATKGPATKGPATSPVAAKTSSKGSGHGRADEMEHAHPTVLPHETHSADPSELAVAEIKDADDQSDSDSEIEYLGALRDLIDRVNQQSIPEWDSQLLSLEVVEALSDGEN